MLGRAVAASALFVACAPATIANARSDAPATSASAANLAAAPASSSIAASASASPSAPASASASASPSAPASASASASPSASASAPSDWPLAPWTPRPQMKAACDAGNAHRECDAMDCDRGAANGCYRYGFLRAQTNEAGAPQEGLRYMERGCAFGSADACFEIGEIELSDIALAGVPPGTWPPTDPEDALRHYKRACDLGNKRGCDAPRARFGSTPDQTKAMCEHHADACQNGDAAMHAPPSGASCTIAAWCIETSRMPGAAGRACALARRGCALKNPGACAAAKRCP